MFISEKIKKRQITIQRQLASSQKYTCSLNERNALSDTSGGALELVMIQMQPSTHPALFTFPCGMEHGYSY